MSFNGSGTFVINSAGQPVVTGTTIASTAFNSLTADLATGLSTTITKDGQSTPTHDIPFGGFKITGLGNGTAATDAVNLSQVQGIFVGSAYSTTATAAGTTTLTVASNPNQYFTGVTTQTVVLPVASTLTALGYQFRIADLSSGSLTVNSSGGNLVATVTANQQVTLTAILLTGTDAASWDVKYSGATAITGTGATVRATGPTMTLDNATGLPISTGVSGLGTGVATFLATPSSANLKTAVTDETGSGALVFANTPTLVTPILGAATATSIAFGHEAMTDYDEVTFTPAFSPQAGSITTQSGSGKATRIGNQVVGSGFISVTTAGTPSGTLTVTGLPFTTFNADANVGAPSISPSGWGATMTQPAARLTKNATTFIVFIFAAGSAGDAAAALANGCTTAFSFSQSLV